MPERLRPWTEIELDGETFRWSAVRTHVSTNKNGRTKRKPMLMVLVGKLDQPALGMLYADATEPTDELAVQLFG